METYPTFSIVIKQLCAFVIRSQTQAVMTATPLNIDEGTFSISNRPIVSMVQSYIHMQPEVEYVLSSVVEEKARRHLSYKIHRAKSLSEKLAGRNRFSRCRTRKIRIKKYFSKLKGRRNDQKE
ncbi:hypothetical protein PHYBLDRAFT_70690 [Phycomyces blakesleeanus NRRL 1555(-)]|uniref:Uncharacterized protein n=1 Tax=Phycomyces blakesleeanus (strain ATCC 8743b / DSM 1359 / FGSC 10004 / NBRC 33097 / NRRL 1555) TaxID=763407 RepID=A0A162Q9Y9_PHYB8|nr:hypothetical protein PHYBLDRAFT_70690 [Phycomyces blakesleeanus NRRL 1555(-)]OAD81306.1 hypothetical protein PHYBLDRAFT_70690 [Phycomyces blakesleeanus NRRL 1555(-)]|eukprot:XP_018299346.1 hypothetical protein PHYBLDRAFT_70690 [Phycomyces blakesleeanus NRRL 1555(-)]